VSDHTERNEKLTVREKVSRFLSTYRIAIIAVAGIILVVVATLSIYSIVRGKRIEASTLMAEELQDSFEEWEAAGEAEKENLEKEILSGAEEIISSYEGLFAAARAHMLRAQIHVAKEEWKSAETDFLKVADSYADTYLAPVALMSAAVSREEQENYEAAIELYRRVEENYSDRSPAAPHALFSIGRLNEVLDRRDAALEAYNGLIDDFSSSDWTKPARSRIIYLESN